MKKLMYGAFALILMTAVISCRENSAENTETSMDQTATEAGMETEVVADSVDVQEEIPADSLQNATPAVQEEIDSTKVKS
ncbi:MAG: hypothetical protein WAM00_02730 [Salegentibacter sp.]